MKRILVISDTHKRIEYAIKVIELIGEIDLVIHLGDLVSDAMDLKSIFPDIEFKYIRGNNDFMHTGSTYEIFNYDGFNLLLTHGHNFSVKTGIDRLLEFSKQLNIDAVLFGHTHIPFKGDYQKDGKKVIILNPGTIGDFSYLSKSYGIMEIENNKLKADFIVLG